MHGSYTGRWVVYTDLSIAHYGVCRLRASRTSQLAISNIKFITKLTLSLTLNLTLKLTLTLSFHKTVYLTLAVFIKSHRATQVATPR